MKKYLVSFQYETYKENLIWKFAEEYKNFYFSKNIPRDKIIGDIEMSIGAINGEYGTWIYRKLPFAVGKEFDV